MGAGQVNTDPGPAKARDRLAVQALGLASSLSSACDRAWIPSPQSVALVISASRR
jgi:hypothetical protein